MSKHQEILKIGLNALKIEITNLCAYLSKWQIEQIFKQAGFPETDDNPTRRGLVDNYYSSLDWNNQETVQKFLKVIEIILLLSDIREETKQYIRNVCKECGFKVSNGHYINNDFIPDLFIYQFPAGLPYGKNKPNFCIKAKNGKQTLSFELTGETSIIKKDVYPDFSYGKFAEANGFNSVTDSNFRKALANMNQTKYERDFFIAYAKKLRMADRDIPVLIPQAWIQWHSLSKKNLRSNSSLYPDDLYRIDFVAFWNNKRFAILIDDISHYGIKNEKYWFASEESYSKRLKEDRKLSSEGWQVFRISNWELKQSNNSQILDNIVVELKNFIGFE
ncbi:conserved hypothetical protein [Hyella patelloides LEGE 07179]|uniref:Uncharacterized protein n=1 Tax=Hyella patelloides LEGE 07179 TaxID=945734 RepID=A0A563VUT7_9CYAN|nr:hypothetical protein [Hyella patelloides]VEP15154.1 conserved hypothetical protein [Hyella patelloides LEGE 07179]